MSYRQLTALLSIRDIEHPSFEHSYEDKLADHVMPLAELQELKVFEIEDKDFESRIESLCRAAKCCLDHFAVTHVFARPRGVCGL